MQVGRSLVQVRRREVQVGRSEEQLHDGKKTVVALAAFLI